jgi:hypothetical protein
MERKKPPKTPPVNSHQRSDLFFRAGMMESSDFRAALFKKKIGIINIQAAS